MPKEKLSRTKASLYRRMLRELRIEFENRCKDGRDQKRIDELDKVICDAESVLYHWKD